MKTRIIAALTLLAVAPALAQEAEFRRIQRPGAVIIDNEYNLEGLTIPKEQIHTLLPRDAIPALTDPALEDASGASWLPDDARVIEVAVGTDVLGVPLRVLDWHEIVNTTLGGQPVAITYCPLCDSAAVFSRKLPTGDVLSFGVSGALYNSNVLMYDTRDMGLWSQLGMRAVSGPLAGTELATLPVEVVSFAAFKSAHPGAKIVGKETGHDRDYERSPYEKFLTDDTLRVPVAGIGDALPRKTLGVGVATDAESWFVPVDTIGDGYVLATPAGDVRLARSEAGVVVLGAPANVRTAQTFYYSWSAFYPGTRVVTADKAAPAAPGLRVGERAPDALLTGIDGRTVRLASLYKDGPVVVTFYRGGWCPFCNQALSAWQSKVDELGAAGGTFIAIAPESTDHAVKTVDKGGLTYTVLSDAAHEAAKAFRVFFTVDDATKKIYLEQYGLDVGASNASGTWDLPAPGTFVIDRGGVVRWAFADWDYKKRADPDEVIRAVKALTGVK